MNDLDIDITGDLSKREFVLGRSTKKDGVRGTAYIGKILSLDGSPGSRVLIDFSTSHVILICGKRGYGKSYTFGTIIEEFKNMPDDVRNRMSAVIYDTMGIFWTLKYPNKKDEILLKTWQEKPEGIDVRVLVPKGVLNHYKERGIPYDGVFSIKPGELEITDWIELFGLGMTDKESVVLSKLLREIEKRDYSIDDMIKRLDEMGECEENEDATANVKNLLRFANGWGLFDADGLDIKDIAKKGAVCVIDVSSLPHTGKFSVRSLVLSIVMSKIYDARVLARKGEELGQLKKFCDIDIEPKNPTSEIPITWLFIDEAHMFVPKGKKTLASDAILDKWIRQGRQPGLGLVLATQMPAALEDVVPSQSDIIVSMRLTALEDIDALSRVRPSYMKEDFSLLIKRMGREKGRALIIDDTTETVQVVQIKPRKTWHGGDASSAI